MIQTNFATMSKKKRQLLPSWVILGMYMETENYSVLAEKHI